MKRFIKIIGFLVEVLKILFIWKLLFSSKHAKNFERVQEKSFSEKIRRFKVFTFPIYILLLQQLI